MSDYEIGNKKPPKSGQIKKGEVRNPRGAGAHKETSRIGSVIKKLTANEITEIGTVLLRGDRTELLKIADPNQNSDRSVLQVWIATCVNKAIDRGDLDVLDTLLNRLIGPVKIPIELEGTVIVADETPEEKQARIDAKLARLKSLVSE